MTTEANAILKEALKLDAIQRAELIEALFRSFETTGTEANDTAWAKEAESRIDAYQAGKLRASAADEALVRISKQ
ncbi:MAG: addiction module protein [Elusimicrobia bacterium]|nr:addiction module protein [Elusimicrobiota bacterium]